MRVTQYATNSDGCFDSTSQFLWLKPELAWWVPTAFTPNRDTKNETWGPVALYGTLSYHMQLFNRWGELIWDNKNPNAGWDGTFNGKPVPDGVYVWRVWLRYIDGRFYAFDGTVTVLR
jgi:gliding motility-associated-like protein